MRFMILAIAFAGSAQAALDPPKDDSGDTGDDTGDSGDDDTGDSGDDDTGDSSLVVPADDTGTGYVFDGHLDGETASQLADEDGGCTTGPRPAAVALPILLVGLAAGRLRRPRR